MWQVAVVVVAMMLSAAVADAKERPQGLLWHRSGLPATLPLQVKSHPGADYVVYLYDPETKKTVLAAYIRGGEFFRVLVPPGTYEVQFAKGTAWKGEPALFGADTTFFVVEPPLTFRADINRKKGHLIDLRNRGATKVRAMADCQRWQLDPESLRLRRFDFDPSVSDSGRPTRPGRFPVTEYEVRGRMC